MVLRAPGDLVLDEVARPRQDASRVQVRVTHSGICGTDFKIYSGAIPVSYPRIMGHEMFGEVVEPGGAEAVRRGDRVIIDPELYCGECFHCRIGQTHLCPNGLLVGRDTDGGFADYLNAPASHVYHVPASIESRTAPMIQVLTTCVHAQRRITFGADQHLAFAVGLFLRVLLHSPVPFAPAGISAFPPIEKPGAVGLLEGGRETRLLEPFQNLGNLRG